MIDKICYAIFGTLDKWCAWVDKMFLEQPKKKKRARNKDGTLKADDPSTPDVNEAWEE